jgi:hypothetical protein
MNHEGRALKILWLPVFIVFITIFIPNMLFAEPALKCPCFSAGEIERAISKAVTTGVFTIECKAFDDVDQLLGDITVAEIFVPTKTGVQIYSMYGSIVNRNHLIYPACGTWEAVFDVDSEGYPINGTGTHKVTINDIAEVNSSEVIAACYNAILEAYPACSNQTSACKVLECDE